MASVVAAAPVNDRPAGATVVDIPSTTRQSTVEATTSALETGWNAICGAPLLRRGVWFRPTPTEDGPVAFDTLASDYSAGILAIEGSARTGIPIMCGPGAIAIWASAAITYRVLVFGDGLSDETSGNLVFKVRRPPPPPAITVTLPRSTGVDRHGTSHLLARLTCTTEDGAGSVFVAYGRVSQRVGRMIIRGYFEVGVDIPCDGVSRTWEAWVPGDNGLFAGGKAATVAAAYGCGALFCSEGYSEDVIQLRRSSR